MKQPSPGCALRDVTHLHASWSNYIYENHSVKFKQSLHHDLGDIARAFRDGQG
jgi:hypothetical protein